jgi:hypothetical protein
LRVAHLAAFPSHVQVRAGRAVYLLVEPEVCPRSEVPRVGYRGEAVVVHGGDRV